MRYEYRVRVLPMTMQQTVNTAELEVMLNEQGAEEFEIVTMSVKDKIVFFQRDVYVERRSKEHIDAVLTAVKSYGDVHDLEFLADVAHAADGTPPVQQVLADDEAWRFLIDRILGES